jgi:hypothetical protein
MKVSINKKLFNIIVGIIIIIAVVGILAGIVIPTVKINQVKNKLSEINVDEFQTKIIDRLKQSPLNVNTKTYKTEFRTLDKNKTELEKTIDMLSDFVDGYHTEVLKDNKTEDRPYTYFVTAFITNIDDSSIGIAIPCFTIQSDSNGNLKSIEYLDGTYTEYSFIGAIIRSEIQNVLNTEYNINTNVLNDLRYKNNKNISFQSNNDKIRMHFSDEDTLIKIFKTISNNMENSYGAYSFEESRLEKETDKILNYENIVVKIDTILMSIE